MLFALGFLSSLVLVAVLAAALMPKMGTLFFTTDESRLDYEGTVEAVRKSIEENELNWVLTSEKDQAAAYLKKGLEGFPYRLHVFKLGNPRHSAEVNTAMPAVSTFMPAAVSICDKGDGKTLIYRKNTSFMGKFFTGPVRKVMGGEVEPHLNEILEGIIK